MLPHDLTVRVVSQSSQCSIFTDAEHFPLVVNRIVGKPTLDAFSPYIERQKALLRYAAAENVKVVIINDFSESTPPDAVVRKRFVEGAEQVGQTHADSLLCWVPIVTSPLIRGVMTALSWMFSDNSNVPIQYANSMSNAISKSLKIFEEMGCPAPNVSPGSYSFPEA